LPAREVPLGDVRVDAAVAPDLDAARDARSLAHERDAGVEPLRLVAVGPQVLPHPDLGQVLVGVTTSAAAGDAAKEQARTLDAAQRPRRWFVVEDLPLTDAGKLDRSTLARLVEEQVAQQPAARTVETP